MDGPEKDKYLESSEGPLQRAIREQEVELQFSSNELKVPDDGEDDTYEIYRNRETPQKIEPLEGTLTRPDGSRTTYPKSDIDK